MHAVDRAADAGDAAAAPGRVAALLCTAGLLVLGTTSRLAHGYEWDELQLLHGAWNVGHGLVPYRDFFEHHPPLLHVLLAPLVAGATDASWSMLITIRLAALAILAGVLVAYAALLRRVVPAAVAVWAPIALLVICPRSGKLFELRADWLALLALLTGLLLLVDSVRLVSDRGVLARHGAAGALAGIAICLTQKAALLWPGVLLWVILETPDGRRATIYRTAALAAGTVVPLVATTLAFFHAGAVGALWDGVVAINVGWPREVGWRACWRASSIAAFGPAVLALASLPAVFTQDRDDVARAPVVLALILAAAGVVAYRLSPVPWEQAFLFLVVPWVGWLALVALGRTTDRRGAGTVVLLAAVVLVAATLTGRLVVRTVVVWLPTALVMRRLLAGVPPERALERAIAVFLLPGVLLFCLDRAGDLRARRGAAQARFRRAVTAHLAPAEPVLAMWDHVLPFRAAPTYHWFAHEGVLRRLRTGTDGRGSLDAEYVGAVERGVRVLILNPDWLATYLPRLERLVARRCRPIADGYAGSDAYACTPAARD